METKDNIKKLLERARQNECPEGIDAGVCCQFETCPECWLTHAFSQTGLYYEDEDKMSTYPITRDMVIADKLMIPISDITKEVKEARNGSSHR